MRIFIFLLGLAIPSAVIAQSPLKNAVEVFSYSIVSEGGTNACAVSYNPNTGYYYTAFAGNAGFPLEVFDNKGKAVAQTETGVDLRSLWYDAKSNALQGLAYPQRGKFIIGLSGSGIPTSIKEPSNRELPSIPNNQSTAFPGGKLGLLLFDGRTVYRLNPANLKQKGTITPSGLPGDIANLNYTTVVYTGVKNYELGFYDSFEAKVYFTDLKGNYTGTSMLPTTAPTATAFRFSYANNLLWLYDADERVWFAYRIF